MEAQKGKVNGAAVDLKDLECFVFDMDGTINLGNTIIDGALELIDTLEKRGTKFFFFTNNSSKSPLDYVAKLKKLGFQHVGLEHIVTSGDVMIHYLKQQFGAHPKVYLSGTKELKRQFMQQQVHLGEVGDFSVDALVVGFDTEFDYERADFACQLIEAGKPFLATNIDRVCPLEGGRYMPDCGSICTMLEHATGRQVKYVGKPFTETVDFILDVAKTPNYKTAMVGDRLYTDIATAVNGGICSIAVLSGEIDMDDILQSEIHPDYILDSVKDIYREIEE